MNSEFMDSDSDDPFPSLFRQFLLVLLSLFDDALIVGLSKLGCEVPCLKVLSPIVLSGTALYLVVQFCKHGIPGLIAILQAFQQEPEGTEA
ncbi:hypothetical protein [Thermocoleostomius sinensis]|uniref:Uncharacterized protein n=1 Tax=Thermocoleostomius sinensis A174 TaxID=2016057 RepID=A0A9E8ZBQ3_9CYAN|nr:hypothetical protein [Thermocoleostomius sinensis]WAL60294.1 hypothetical protein OXH18_24540 [Thermocoleostomius sinensis A174]